MSPRRCFFLLLLMVLVLAPAPLGAGEGTRWHQYYEPVETPERLALVADALAEAQRLYGEPVVPVREVHLRRSIPRRHPDRLARADIHDWPRFCRRLVSRQGEAPWSRVWKALPADLQQVLTMAAAKEVAPSPTEQLALVDALNDVVGDRGLYDEAAFGRLGVDRELHKLAERGGVGFFRRNIEPVNRQLLTLLFPDTLLPKPEEQKVARGILLTELADRQRGRLVIYLRAAPADEEFFLQLAHEVAHLLNADLFDWYVEGLNNVFAERLAEQRGRSFELWRRRFERDRERDPYAIAWLMMRRVSVAAGPAAMKRFLDAAVAVRPGEARQRIDINRWLATLPAPRNAEVRAIIRHYAPHLREHGGTVNAFMLPGPAEMSSDVAPLTDR